MKARKKKSEPFYRLTLRKVDEIYYEIVSIETNIPERAGKTIATVWCGTAARGCEFYAGMRLNKWQAAQHLNETSVTLIGLDPAHEKLAANSFYNSYEHPNKYHRSFG